MKLTEELVLQRTKAKSLGEVRSLNMWGQDISDVEVLLQMPNVEVLSLSVNGISSLSSFRKCHQLRELYLRKNDVKNLADIQYLAAIKCLKILWLSDNPCAETLEYRATVIQYLPNLEKLDNVDITDSERLAANSEAFMLPKLEDSLELKKETSLSLGTPRETADLVVGLDGGQAQVEKKTRGDVAPKDSVNASPNVLYAVIALLEELDEDSLRIVKAEVDSRLKKT